MRPADRGRDGRSTADDDAGERRYATIVFSDLSGYTALNERVDPEERPADAELRSLATTIVEAQGGVVNQFVGDEIMALFGMPQAGRDACAACVARGAATAPRGARLAERHAPRLGVRIELHSGVNSGLVVARPRAAPGPDGLTGDAVNTAARLLKLAEAGEIVVGQDTWRMVSAHFEAERLPPTAVRGKAAALQPWRVLREVEMPPAAPLIGRDDELRHARAALHACIDAGAARWVVIRGEPASASHACCRRSARWRATWARLICAAVPDFGRRVARWLCVRCSTACCSCPPTPTRRRWATALPMPAWVGATGPRVHAARPRRTRGRARGACGDGQRGARRGTVDALVALVRRHSAHRAVLLALEDVHWAEPPALALLARVAGGCRDRPLLLAVTTRPQSEGFDAARRAHAADLPALTLDLNALGLADARQPGAAPGRRRR